MTYKLTQAGGVQRISDGAFIPADSGNRDFGEYMAWRAKGNAPAPADPPPVAKPVVSPFQARAALLGAGLLAQVQAYMDHPNTPQITVLAWNYASEFRRDSPTVMGLGAILGLDTAGLDALFATAGTIEA